MAVQDGTIIGVSYKDDPTPVSGTVWTIEGLFNLMQDAIDQIPAKIEVDYDETYGYPTLIFIDKNELIADEEIDVFVNEFYPIGGGLDLTPAPQEVQSLAPQAAPTSLGDGPQAELDVARALWDSLHLDDYRYEYSRASIFLPRTYLVAVQDSAIICVSYNI
jgi:hypothetical protein